MKTLAELKDEVMLGLHVCAPADNGGTTYIFRRGNGHIVHAYGYAPGKFTIYHDVTLIREDEPGYDPADYENLLANALETQPIWQTCIIPDELMARFITEADENERWHQANRAQMMYAKLRMERRKQEGEEGVLIEEIPHIDLSSDDDLLPEE